MLEKRTRKKLREQNWLDIEKSDSNPYASLRRWRDQANRAINDLALLAEKLPCDIQQEIFNHATINKLVRAMLKVSPVSQVSVDDNARKTGLASLLVRIGADLCIQQYSQKIETNSVLNRLIINQIKESMDICDEIAFKMRIQEIKSIEAKGDLIYLFNWNKIEEIHETRLSEVKGEDTMKFIRFIDKEREFAPIDIVHKIAKDAFASGSLAREFEFTDRGGYRFKGDMGISLEEKVARLFVEEKSIQEDRWQRDLIVRVENENVIVYRKDITKATDSG
ncbi:MAG: hypothetical protein M3044_06550 [Thermoproteota archaeon]|nr:hypothetical protein [Thermoproteota archaeon]